jgi:hypothetical protein
VTPVASGGLRTENLDPPSSRAADLAPSTGTPKRNRVAEILGPIIVFFVAQRYFIQGIVVSGVKG